MKISIIVLEYIIDEEIFETIKKNVESIIRYTNVPYELVLVDNGSPLHRGWITENSDVQVRLEKNESISLAWTKGLEAATGDVLCLMDNDVFVTEGWIKPLLKELEDEKVGIAMPMAKCKEDDYEGKFLDNSGFSFRLTGFCFLFRDDVYKSVGNPDYENFPIANFEDDDYFKRVMDKGYILKATRNSKVFHIGRATNDKLPHIKQSFLKHREAYVRKHGNNWPEFIHD